jgi:hypothetical protein
MTAQRGFQDQGCPHAWLRHNLKLPAKFFRPTPHAVQTLPMTCVRSIEPAPIVAELQSDYAPLDL